jgi:mRNA interferase RelE/StbE
MTSPLYEVRYLKHARRALASNLPESVAAAVFQFCSGPLAENPPRVGVGLHPPFERYHSARRGTYRVVYSIIESERIVYVEWIGHRADVYRPRG